MRRELNKSFCWQLINELGKITRTTHEKVLDNWYAKMPMLYDMMVKDSLSPLDAAADSSKFDV